MKKLISIVLTVIMCLSLCFCFVGCSDIFDGNYKLVANEDINSTLMGLRPQPSYGSMNGLYINLELKSKDLTMKATLKYLDVEKLFSFKMDMQGSSEDESMAIEAYYDGEYFYSRLASGEEEFKSKRKDEDADELSGLVNYFDIVGQMQSDVFENIFDFDADTIKELKVKVYVDDSEGTKIKMVFSENEEDIYGIGKAYFVFDALKVLKAMKLDMKFIEDGETYTIKMEMKEFDGKITLPKGISDWEETEID